MPTYPTPTPIDLAIKLSVGAVNVIASDRAEAIVTVVPTNSKKEADVRGAEQTVVEFDGQQIKIVGPRPRVAMFGPNESIDVTVELPTGSRVTAELGVGGLRATGRLGATRIKGSLGSATLESTGDLWVRNSHGGTTVAHVDGTLELTNDHGQIRVGTVTGDAVLKASHGSVLVGEAGGDLEAKLSYGDLDITSAHGSVAAKTAYGNIQLGTVDAGSHLLESGFGGITVGVRSGVPAWLDLSSKNGHVRNELSADSAPAEAEQSVSVHARTEWGDISVHRAA